MLSYTQEKVLKAIRFHYSTFGYSPSIRDIGKLCGMKSTNTVHRHLKALQNKGIISTEQLKARAIKILIEQE